MFFDKKLLIGLIVYLIAAAGLSFAGITTENVIIYVEELKKMNIFDFVKSFYVNLIETYNHQVTSDQSKSSSSTGLILFLVKLFVAGALLNFTFSSINKGKNVMLFTYIILTPFFLYFSSLYLIEYDYVVFHTNSLLFFISYVIGFGFIMVFFDKSESKLETSELFLTIIGFILLYTFGKDEFQSSLLITSITVMFLGAVVAFISGIIIKDKKKEPIKMEVVKEES